MMIKRISLLLVLMLMVACGSNKRTASSSKSKYKKPHTTVVRNVKKPASKRTTNATKSGGRNTNSDGSRTEVLQAVTKVQVTTDLVWAYIDQYKEIAKDNMRKYGVPSSITMAQAILESGAGTGPLSVNANNHFGIKCHKGWTGPSVSHDDDSAGECFRKYDQPGESFQDHSMFLTTRSRYAALFTLDKDDYKGWAKGLRSAGYATDSRYPEKLISLIDRYQLTQFDAEVLGKNYVAVNTKEAASPLSDMYQVSPGDTLYSISKKFNLTVEELRRKNNISENAISIGQNLKIK